MPEGPQARRAGNLIEKHAGSAITAITHPPSRRAWDIPLPIVIERVEVIGKNIFIYLENGQIIYNHMLMWGSWRATCEVIGTKRLNTCFTTSSGCLGYFGGGILKLLDPDEAAIIRARLGPEVMTAVTSAAAFEQLTRSALPIGEALLAQNLVSGVGNIYKSEGLFAAKIHPLRRSSDIGPRELERLFRFLQPQMKNDVQRPGPITTTPSNLIKKGIRTFVYRRYHQPCIMCSTKIERIYQGKQNARSTYFCPYCQPI